MINIDEDALFCDFVETYGIIGYRELEAATAARLAAGLRSDSRIKSKAIGMEQPIDTYLSAAQLDALRLILWTKTKDAEKNRNKPKPITDILMNKKDQELKGSESIEDFRAARESILRGVNK